MSFNYLLFTGKNQRHSILAVVCTAAILIVIMVVLFRSQQEKGSSQEIIRQPFDAEEQQAIKDAQSTDEARAFKEIYPNSYIDIDRSGNIVKGEAVKFTAGKEYPDKKISQTISLYIAPYPGSNSTNYDIQAFCVTHVLGETGTSMTEMSTANVTKYLHDTTCAK